MSEFFKAAAHCDITVVRKSPIFLNEKAILEEEISQRQFDTIDEKIQIEKELKDQMRSAELSMLREQEQEERMKKLRLEESRKEAIRKKEAERMARADVEQRKAEDLERARLMEIEAQRATLGAEREQSKLKAQQKAHEEVQKVLRRAAEQAEGIVSDTPIPEQGDLTYMDRLRVEKERVARTSKANPDGSITNMYDAAKRDRAEAEEKGLDGSRRFRSQLERDIVASREAERIRLEMEREVIRQEEREQEEKELSQKKEIACEKSELHKSWLVAERTKRDETTRLEESWRREALEKQQQRHVIDEMHASVRQEYLKEQEAEAMVQGNLQEGVSYLDRLEQYMEAERSGFREQQQLESELENEQYSYEG